MSAELIEQARAHVARLEAEAAKWRTVLTLMEESENPPPGKRRAAVGKSARAGKVAKGAGRKGPPGPKPGRRGETGNPPASPGGERAKTRRRVSDILEKHPEATAKEIGEMLDMNASTIAYHLTQLRKA